MRHKISGRAAKSLGSMSLATDKNIFARVHMRHKHGISPDLNALFQIKISVDFYDNRVL
jgi:hypothetical protein